MPLLFASILVFLSCSNNDLEGSWTGFQLSENGAEMTDSKAELCSLHIANDGYFFRGNTGVIEIGLLTQKQAVLYMQDTLRELPTKQIAYKLHGEDTLELIMNDDSNEVRLKMARKSSGD